MSVIYSSTTNSFIVNYISIICDISSDYLNPLGIGPHDPVNLFSHKDLLGQSKLIH